MKDFIIVGGGILGATTAYKLAKSGADILLVDQSGNGQATDAAAGVICPWLSQRRNKKWYSLARNGARIYPSIVRELKEDGEIETGYAKVGALSIHHAEEKLLAMKERAITRKEEAPEIGEISLLSPKQTRELFPLLDESYSSIHISGAARVDGRVFRNALLRAAKKYGAELLDGHATLYHSNSRVKGIYINDTIYEAKTVIAACGAWMGELLQPLGIHFQARGQKGQLLHLELQNEEANHWPVLMPPTSQSIVPFKHRLVIGATHENDVGFDQRITAGGIHDILSKALEVLPSLSDSPILEARVGFRPFTPEFLPVIGTIQGISGLMLANGLGSSGLTTGPFVGTQLAKLALGEKLDIELKDYDVHGALFK
ncbi:NAD(P)/FAD-dependent oxidoreductase [Ornithinibacillus bavariensis]|uniref:NAD(P)/FAD-dependent oxidoreductase n=1 Tax=Ornithinibacillus bavariensis TaxID=545502 RepID=UPI000EBD3966|nr:FAD-dependent oxidoreductase [Ornithinibacillus sp.]